MENSLKQRIVGAVVLIALAVIFLPSILKEKNHQEPFFSEIPAKPVELLDHEIAEDVREKNRLAQKQLDSIDEQHKKHQELILEQDESPVENTGTTNTNIVTDKQDIPTATDVSKEKEQGTDKEPQKAKIATKVTQEPAAKTNQAIVKEGDSVKNAGKTIGQQFKDAAWVIKIASFSNKKNAVSFVNKLKSAGHRAYQRRASDNKGKPLFRIYAGPYIEKKEALEALTQVNQMSSSSGILLPYDPIKH